MNTSLKKSLTGKWAPYNTPVNPINRYGEGNKERLEKLVASSKGGSGRNSMNKCFMA